MRRAAPSLTLALVLPLALGVTACRGSGSGPSAPRGSGGAESLSQRWRWVAPRPSSVGMPGADGEGVAVAWGHSHVTLLDAGGRPRWTADRGIDQPSLRDVAPRLAAGAVLVPTEEGLLALDRATGTPRWEARTGERANTPVVAGGRAVVSTWEGSLVAFDLDSGRVDWRTALPGVALGAAAGDDGVVAAVWEAEHGDGAGVVAVEPASGRQRWAASLPGGGVGGPGLVAGPGGPLVVVVAGDVAAHALAANSGEERWFAPLEGAGSPEVAPLDAGDGTVLVAHRLGGLALLDTDSGRPHWAVSSDGAAVRGGPAGRGPAGSYALTLDDGRVLVAAPGGTTHLLDPRGRVSGVAAGPGGVLLVATRGNPENDLTALSGW